MNYLQRMVLSDAAEKAVGSREGEPALSARAARAALVVPLAPKDKE